MHQRGENMDDENRNENIGENEDEDITTEPVDPENPDILPENPDEPIGPEEPEEPDTPETPDVNDWLYKGINNFYERVRMSLNSSAEDISDTIIDFPENAPMAEVTIKTRLPEWKDFNEYQQMLFETCIVYMTCYQLCRVAYARNIKSQTTPHLKLEFYSNTAEKPCERFLALIDDLIAQIKGEEPDAFWGFRVTPPSMPLCWMNKHIWNENDPLRRC